MIRVTGRIRDEGNSPVAGFRVEAHFTDRLGARESSDPVATTTDSSGSFGLTFERPASDHSDRPDDVRLEVKDQSGKRVLVTQSRENTTGRFDFQIKVGEPRVLSADAEIYAGGFERLISRYIGMGDTIDSSDQSVRQSLEYIVGVVKRWGVNRDELARACGLEVIQVPKHPRRARHNHVTRWDEVILKV